MDPPIFKEGEITDLVLIHAYKRVGFLYPQIKSFIDNQKICNCPLGEHKILFVIVDDSNNIKIENKFCIKVEKIKKYINDVDNDKWGIDYWDKRRQRILISAIGGDENSVFFRDAEVDKVGGVRTIQNISHIIAEYLFGKCRREDVMIHKLDDDIFPYSMSFEKDYIYKISPIKNFFCQKRLFLNKLSARVVGSYYTLDGPSPVTDLFEVVEAIYILLSVIKKENIFNNTYPWHLVKPRLYVYGVPKRVECAHLNKWIKRKLNLSHISETYKLSKLLDQILYNLRLFNIGVNRFEYNLENHANDRDWGSEHSLISGGCLSFMADEPLSAAPNFADQDLLWTYLEHITKGGIKGDFSVLHLKTNIMRQGFVDTIIRGKASDIRCCFPLTVRSQEMISKVLGINLCNEELLNFGGFGPNIVENTGQRLKVIINILCTLLNTKLDTNNARRILKNKAMRIKNIIQSIADGYTIITDRYEKINISSKEDKKLQKSCRNWLKSNKNWGVLCERARNINQEF